MVQERRLRVTHTVHTRKNNRLLKAKKGLTNSLPLRQLSILSLTQSIVFQVWASMLHIRLRPCTILLTWNFSKFIFSVFCLLKKIDFYTKFYFKIRWKLVYCLVDILLNNLCKFPFSTFVSSRVLLSREQKSDSVEKTLTIDRCWGIDSGDCSVCLERLKKRKVTLKQCEAAVWSGSEFAEHCFVFSNLSFFLVFPVYRTRSLHQSLNICLLEETI